MDNEKRIIRDRILASAEIHGDLPAFLQKANKEGAYAEISYRQLVSDVRSLGAKLLDMGLKGEKIALIGANCYQWMVVYLAVVSGVGIVVPLDKELRREEILNLLKRADCKAAFYAEEFEPVFAEAELTHRFRFNVYTDGYNPEGAVTLRGLIEEAKQLPAAALEDYDRVVIDPDAMAILLFTSGTTGDAKGVMLTNRSITVDLDGMASVLHAGPGDRTLSILPMHHCFESIFGVLHMLSHGVSIAIGDGLKYIVKNLEEAGVSVLLAVPLLVESLFKRIWRNAEREGREKSLRKRVNLFKTVRFTGIGVATVNEALREMGEDIVVPEDADEKAIAAKLFAREWAELGGKLRLIFTGAAAIDPKVITGLHDIGIKVMQGYGMTEGGPLLTATPDYADTYTKSGSVGPVLYIGKMAIANPDETGVGEVIYSSESVMKGYYNMPEATAAVMRDGWYYSGDFGYMDDAGWLYITGRKKNIIVTKTGKNIYPEELEAVLGRNPYISELMVYGTENTKRGGPVVAVQIRPDYEVIREEHGAEISEAEVMGLLKEAVAEFNAGVPNYKRIRSVMIRHEEFIRTASKKIKRDANI